MLEILVSHPQIDFLKRETQHSLFFGGGEPDQLDPILLSKKLICITVNMECFALF